MALCLDSIFEDMVRQFSTITTNGRFRSDFVTAVNKTLDELEIAGDLSSPITHVNTPTDTISSLSADDMFIVAAGCVKYLIAAGREHVLKERTYDVANQEWEDRKADFWTKAMRTLQASVDDDLSGEGASIIGLGDVTEE